MARPAFLIACLLLALAPWVKAEEPSAPAKSEEAVRPPAPVPETPAAATQAPGAKAPEPPRPQASGPEILLTFDDGPRLDLTPRVLELLDAHGIRAVFFVNGWHFQGKSAEAERSRAMLREIMRRGHLVGNHTVHHFFLCGQRGPRIAESEIEDNARLIEQAIGMRPLLYRTPYGAHCATLSATLGKLGIKSIGWDIDPQDWKLRDADKIFTFVQGALKRLKRRAIVLFHDVQPATVAALPRVLDWIDQENAARRLAKEPQIRYIDYGYLLPTYPIVPPIIDNMGRLLIDAARSSPLPTYLLWPLAPLLDSPHA